MLLYYTTILQYYSTQARCWAQLLSQLEGAAGLTLTDCDPASKVM